MQTVAIDKVRYTHNVMMLWCSLILGLFSISVSGYSIYIANHALQVPLVQWLNDRTLYSNDYFTNSLPYYCSMLWRLVAFLVKYASIESVFLWGFILERILLIYAAGRLAFTLSLGSWIATVGSMVLFSFGIKPIIGGGTIVTDCFEQTGLSIPFFLLSMVAFYENRKMFWAVLLAVGFNLNSMYGAYAFSYFAAAIVFNKERLIDYKEWLKAGFVFLILSLPVLLYSFRTYSMGSFNSSQWIAATKYILSCHLYPTTWSLVAYFKLIALILLSLTLRRTGLNLFKQGMIWTTVCVAWIVLSFLAAFFALPGLLVLQPARAADLWCCFIVIALVSTFGKALENREKQRLLNAVLFTISIVYLTSLSDIQMIGFVVIVSGFLLVISRLREKIVVPSLSVLLLLTVIGLGVAKYLERGMTVRANVNEQIQQLANWAKANTSKDSVFLVDPTWADFREIAERNVFVTLKDGSAELWYRPYVDEWIRRLELLDIRVGKEKDIVVWTKETEDDYKKRYSEITTSDIKLITDKYKLNYVVMPINSRAQYKTVYKNCKYKILKI